MAAQQVGDFADERDDALRERLLQLGGRAERDHLAAIHQREAVAILGFVHVVGADEDGVAGGGKLIDQIPEGAAGDGVDAGGGFVQEQNGRLMQDGAAQRQALLPAAGEQAGQAGAALFDARHAQHVVLALGPAVARRRRRCR